MENGTLTTNANDTIVLYDILRYFHIKIPTTDARAAADGAMTLLKETLGLIDSLSHGYKGPLSISSTVALLTESVETITDFGLEPKDVYLNPDIARRRYFGRDPGVIRDATLEECVNRKR